jgi:membrane fusion protein
LTQKSRHSNHSTHHQPLFRPEARDHHRATWVGTISIEKSHTPSLVLVLISLATFVLIGILIFGTYSRQAVISGLVIPNKGLIKINAPVAGTATDVFVNQGQIVRKGSALFTITSEVFSEGNIALGGRTLETLDQQQSILKNQLEIERVSGQVEVQMLFKRVEALRAQKNTIEKRFSANKNLLSADSENLARQQDLLSRQLVTRDSVTALQNTQMERILTQEQIKQDLENQDIAINDAETTLKRRSAELEASLALINRNLADIEQQKIAADTKRSSIAVAPDTGQITSLQVAKGGAVSAGVPLVTIVPSGSKLQVHLYGPSRSTGLVRKGQRVSLRFEAFPFQRYGLVKGYVSSVSGSAVNPTELPLELSGLVNSSASDSLYKVVVDIDDANGRNTNKNLELAPGMKVQANVILETRPLYKWIVSPAESVVKSGFE